MKNYIAPTFALAGLAFVAQAEQNTEPTSTEPSTDLFGNQLELVTPLEKESVQTLLDTDQIVSAAIYNLNDEKIGTIDRLVVDPNTGKVNHAVVSVGGFLGIGDRLVAVPWDQFQVKKVWNTDEVLQVSETKKVQESAAAKEAEKAQKEFDEKVSANPLTDDRLESTEARPKENTAVFEDVTTAESATSNGAFAEEKSAEATEDVVYENQVDAVEEANNTEANFNDEAVEDDSSQPAEAVADFQESEPAKEAVETTAEEKLPESSEKLDVADEPVLERTGQPVSEAVPQLQEERVNEEEEIDELARVRIYLDVNKERLEEAPVYDSESTFVSKDSKSLNEVDSFWNAARGAETKPVGSDAKAENDQPAEVE